MAAVLSCASAEAAIFTGVSSVRLAQTGVAPASDPIAWTGPVDYGFDAWFGNSTSSRPGIYAFASHGSSLTETSISAVGETFVSNHGGDLRVGAQTMFALQFTLDEAATVTLFANGGNRSGAYSSLGVRLVSSTQLILSEDGLFTDFRELALSADTYYLTASLLNFSEPGDGAANGYYNLSMTVPGPGPVVPFLLAGLFGGRRRRVPDGT